MLQKRQSGSRPAARSVRSMSGEPRRSRRCATRRQPPRPPPLSRATQDPRPQPGEHRPGTFRGRDLVRGESPSGTDDDGCAADRASRGAPLASARSYSRTDPGASASASGTGATTAGTVPRSDCSAASRATARSRSSLRGGQLADDAPLGDERAGTPPTPTSVPARITYSIPSPFRSACTDREPMARLPGGGCRSTTRRRRHRARSAARIPSPSSRTSRSPSCSRRTRCTWCATIAGRASALDSPPSPAERRSGGSSRSPAPLGPEAVPLPVEALRGDDEAGGAERVAHLALAPVDDAARQQRATGLRCGRPAAGRGRRARRRRGWRGQADTARRPASPAAFPPRRARARRARSRPRWHGSLPPPAGRCRARRRWRPRAAGRRGRGSPTRSPRRGRATASVRPAGAAGGSRGSWDGGPSRTPSPDRAGWRPRRPADPLRASLERSRPGRCAARRSAPSSHRSSRRR